MNPAKSSSVPRILGILNVTPDSFSDGGQHDDTRRAVAHGLKLVSDGADILDIGGESTRPGADPVTEAEEIRRTIPVIKALRHETDTPISIDTMKPNVARAAMRAGASIWNDVNALRSPRAAELAAELGCSVMLMHMQGDPRTMQAKPAYDDVVAEVEAFLLGRAEAVMEAGVSREKIVLDPGIGFGKSLDHNLALLRATDRFAGHGFPVMIAASRKRFIALIDDHKDDGNRLGGSINVALFAAAKGAAFLRVHDVRETVQALAVQAVLAAES